MKYSLNDTVRHHAKRLFGFWHSTLKIRIPLSPVCGLGVKTPRSIRENISSEMWEQLNDAYLLVTNTSEQWAMAEPHEFFRDIKLASHLFMGLTDNVMSHSEGWHFSQLGRLIERADKTSRIVDVKYFILLPSVWDVNTPFDDIQWGALLHSASGF